jgi:hypothetical protein
VRPALDLVLAAFCMHDGSRPTKLLAVIDCGSVRLECTQDSHAIDGSAAVPMRPLDGVGMLWCSNNTKNDIEQLATRVCDMKRAWFVSSRRQ